MSAALPSIQPNQSDLVFPSTLDRRATPAQPVSTPAGTAPPAQAETVLFRHSWRARHYRLTLRRDGVAVATIPARGSEQEARRFVAAHQTWLERARARQPHTLQAAEGWRIGTAILWRGLPTEIRHAIGDRPAVCLGSETFRLARLDGDLRTLLEAQLLLRAKIELPGRAWELAAETDMAVKRISVRSQRSRWGSCSAGGTISLNWRLIQTPASVRDYIIYHELMHLREMNHSQRFWAHVEEVCPSWREAERWLKLHGPLLGL